MTKATVILGDCVEKMQDLYDQGFKFKLIFADPPSNNGSQYDVHNDSMRGKTYVLWTDEWVGMCERLLQDGGQLFVYGKQPFGEYLGPYRQGDAERVSGHPNQIPESYLRRIIRAYTDPGDLILDPFGGTGTTAVVADAMGRPSVTIEKSLGYCDDIKARLERGAVKA